MICSDNVFLILGKAFSIIDERLLKLDCFFKIGKVKYVEGESEDDLSDILLSEVLMVA